MLLSLASGEWPRGRYPCPWLKLYWAFNSMGAIGPTSDPGITADFPWDAITKGKDGIVDVGGGQGTLCCSLAAK